MNRLREHGIFLYILFSSLLTVLAVLEEWNNPLRWLLVGSFLMICPGLAFHRLVPSSDPLTRLFLVVIFSLTFDLTAAQIFLYLGKWSPHTILFVLVGLCAIGLLWELISRWLLRFRQAG